MSILSSEASGLYFRKKGQLDYLEQQILSLVVSSLRNIVRKLRKIVFIINLAQE